LREKEQQTVIHVFNQNVIITDDSDLNNYNYNYTVKQERKKRRTEYGYIHMVITIRKDYRIFVPRPRYCTIKEWAFNEEIRAAKAFLKDGMKLRFHETSFFSISFAFQG